MCESTFTNCEWQVVNGIFVGSRPHDSNILDACCINHDEARANALLLSKAPKMYEMLESVARELYMLIDEVNDQRVSLVTSQTDSEPAYHDMQTLPELQQLLTETRGKYCNTMTENT